MIIFTPQRARNLGNPKFFDVTCAIGKNAGLKFLPDITHCDRPWNTTHVTLTSADPDTVMRFTQWEHVDLFKHSDRKKIIILDQFEPHYHLQMHTGQEVRKLKADAYYPRPPASGIDYSWADLIICIQEEMVHGPAWIDFLNNPDEYFGTSPGRVITIMAGALDNINSNPFPYNTLRVPLNLWCAWVAAANSEVIYDTSHYRPYKFEALLGGAKRHRTFLFNQLRKNHLLEHGLVSISAQTYRRGDPKTYDDTHYRTPELDHYDLPEMVVMREQTRNHNWVAHTTNCLGMEDFPIGNGKSVPVMPYGSFFIPHRVYQNSWFSIIAETLEQNCDFFTEKTAKVLFGRRIFVTFGPQHSLKTIRTAGFKTFGFCIDESYDDEPDNTKRWTQAFEQVVKLINHPNPQELYDQAHSVLEHNYHRIINPKAMLGPVDNFIQSFLNGTARPDPAWKPIPQGDGYARMMQELEQSHNLDAPLHDVLEFPKPQKKKSSPTQVNSSTTGRLFDSPEILNALEQARASTRLRQSQQSTQVNNWTPPKVNSSTAGRLFDGPEILNALEQARASTRLRRSTQIRG